MNWATAGYIRLKIKSKRLKMQAGETLGEVSPVLLGREVGELF
jgi:hypothetical protein